VDIPTGPVAITKWDTTIHGPRFLWFWYFLVYQAQEHTAMWGRLALDPYQWLAACAQTDIYVLHRQQSSWSLGDGLILVVWLDDNSPGASARLHAWMHPQYRHPSFTDPMGRLMLGHLFTTGPYQLLEARIPAPNAPARRWIHRLGFSKPRRLPHAVWLYAVDGQRWLADLCEAFLTRDAYAASLDSPGQASPPATIQSAPPNEVLPWAANGLD